MITDAPRARQAPDGAEADDAVTTLPATEATCGQCGKDTGHVITRILLTPRRQLCDGCFEGGKP